METRIINIGDKKLSMRVMGKGRPMILFHSLLADSTSFDLISGELAISHEVFLFNLPGFDDSSYVSNEINVVADHLAEGIKQLNLNQNPILLGNGFGGFLSLILTIRYPDIPSKLVLADCGATFSEAGRNAFKVMMFKSLESGLGAVADTAMKRLFSKGFQEANPDLIALRRQHFLSMNRRTFQDACMALASLDIRDQVTDIKQQALILVGEFDKATPPAMATELNSLMPNSTLKVLENCAHVPQLQAPKQFLELIHDFV